MGLFKPIWMKEKLSDSRLEKAKAVVRALTEDERIKVATDAPNLEVRIAAVETITDQKVLFAIAKNDKDSGVRGVAAGRLTDPQRIGKFVLESLENARYPGVLIAALKNLDGKKVVDQKVLMEVSLSADIHWEAAELAAELITDQNLLLEIALKTDLSSADMAAKKLTDQAKLEKVALEAESSGARLFATKKITDQWVLTQIARNDENLDVICAAVDTLGKNADDLIAVGRLFRFLEKNLYPDQKKAQACLERLYRVTKSQSVKRAIRAKDRPYFTQAWKEEYGFVDDFIKLSLSDE